MFRLINTKDLVSFGILFFLVTSAVTNNFFIKIASNFADRFLFVPVIGYLLFLAGIILRLLKIQPGDAVKNKTARFIFFGLCLLFCFLSYARIPVWQNNFELYKSGVITAPNSARTYSSLGYAYINKAQYASNLNDQSLFLSEAKENFKQSLNIVATNFDSYFNLGNIALMEGDTNAAKNFYQQCLKLSPEYRMANHNLALIYSNRNQNDSALYYLDKIPMNIAEYQMEYPVYSYIYLQKKNFQKARYYTEKGISEAPNDPVNYKNMSEVFLALDDTANAIAYYQKYRELGGR